MRHLMTTAMINEIETHVTDAFNDGRLTNDNKDDWHHTLFLEKYYIVGENKAEQWLKGHDISAFEAIGVLQEWEQQTFGEATNIYSDAETTVNMLMDALGEYWLYNNDGFDFIDTLILNENQRNEFDEWVESDNVMCFENGLYGAQCNQYSKQMTKDELFEYFKDEYLDI